MKQIHHLLILLSSCLSLHNIHAAIGCMDSSYHVLRETYYQNTAPSITAGLTTHARDLEKDHRYPTDYKAYHFVHCTCPCDHYQSHYLNKQTAATGYCPVCRHRGTHKQTAQRTIVKTIKLALKKKTQQLIKE